MEAENEKKEWFASWFDSPLYHILYKHRNQDEANQFIDHMLQKLGIEYGTMLDLACGKGRHAYYLAEKGFDVTGVDLSKESIEFAKTMYKRDNLEFYEHDMRKPFRVNFFDYIFNFFTSIGYFKSLDENNKVFAAIHAGLKLKGKVLIDFMNSEKVMHNLVKRENKVIDDYKFYLRREVSDGKIIKNIHIEKEEHVWIFKEEVQALKPHHFHQFLNNNGLTLLQEFGDYELNTFHPKRSDRYIVLAQKI